MSFSAAARTDDLFPRPSPRSPLSITDLAVDAFLGGLASDSIAGISEESVRVARIRRGRDDPCYFMATYLPTVFNEPFGEHHYDMANALLRGDASADVSARVAGTGVREPKYIVRVEPRGHGKTSFLLKGGTIWLLAYRLKEYLLLIGETETSVKEHFSTVVQLLEDDDSLLLQDFPHLAPKRDRKGQYVSWRDNRIALASDAVVTIRGVYSAVLGISSRKRPDAVFVDDPQDRDKVRSAMQRERLARQINRTVLGLGAKDCDYYFTGNLLHLDGYLSRQLLNSTEPGSVWDGKLYCAYNRELSQHERYPVGNSKTDGEPLWPEVWSREALEHKRLAIGSTAFAIEYENDLRAGDDQLYDPSQFMLFDPEMLDTETLSGMTVIAFHDPATGEQRKNKGSDKPADPDFTAIAVVGSKALTRDGLKTWLEKIGYAERFARLELLYLHDKIVTFYWVRECYVAKSSPSASCNAASVLARRYPIIEYVYESNAAFSLLIPELLSTAKKRGMVLPLRRIHQSRNKIQRIMFAEGAIKERTFFSSRIRPLYFTMWADFPHGKDDGPDATVAAIEWLEVKSDVGGGST